MNVLAIGNSYSEDATRYLHQLARTCNRTIHISNLYIGGCCLAKHYRNMCSEKAVYTHMFNGFRTGLKVSLKEALLTQEWDVITVQQHSFKSTQYETFQPYLNELLSYVRKFAPKAKIAVHQTWGYKDGTESLQHYESGSAMFKDSQANYEKVFYEIGADILIPSGETMEGIKARGIRNCYRDSIHASKGIGRYALGLIWLKALTGICPYKVGDIDLDEEVSQEELEVAKDVVANIHLKSNIKS